MPEERLVLLQTQPTYIPLYWTSCQLHLTWPMGIGAVCRLLTPSDFRLRQDLLDVFLSQQALPCMLKDPARAKWYGFQALLTTYDLRDEVEVTLVSHGTVRETDASRYAPLTLRKKRKDAGQPRKPRRIETVGEV